MQSDQVLANVSVLITSASSEGTVQTMADRYQGFLRQPFEMQSVLSQIRAIVADAANPRACLTAVAASAIKSF